MTPVDSFLRLAYRPGIVNYLTPLQGSFSSSNPKFFAIASAIVRNTWSGNFKVTPKIQTESHPVPEAYHPNKPYLYENDSVNWIELITTIPVHREFG
jgi:hypothetical protein